MAVSHSYNQPRLDRMLKLTVNQENPKRALVARFHIGLAVLVSAIAVATVLVARNVDSTANLQAPQLHAPSAAPTLATPTASALDSPTEQIEPSPTGAITGFFLVDSETGEEGEGLHGGDVKELSLMTSAHLRAVTGGGTVGSIIWSVRGPTISTTTTITVVSSESPFLLDLSSSCPWESGFYNITATPYSNPEGLGLAGPPLQVSIQVTQDTVPTTTMEVTRFVLFDTESSQDVGLELVDNQVIERDAYGGLSIRAETEGAVGSVRFELDDESDYKVENRSPYYLHGNAGAGSPTGFLAYPSSELATRGMHVVTATPFEHMDGQGAAGASLTVRFTIL